MATSLPTRHPGNLAVRDFRGASRNVRHGETVNPPAIERAGPETPHLQRGALDLYPNRRHHSKPDPRLDPTRPERASPINFAMPVSTLDASSRAKNLLTYRSSSRPS